MRAYSFGRNRLVTSTDVREASTMFHSPRAIAHQYDLSERTVYRWISTGALPVTRIGRLVRVSDSDLRAFMRQQQRQSVAV